MTPDNSTEQQDVIADYASGLQQIEVEGYERAVRKARNALFWAGGLIFASEMINMFKTESGFSLLIFIIALVEAGIFVALAFWTKKKSYTAVIMGLIAFIGIIILSVIGNGMDEGGVGVLKGLFSGIIVKVAILVNLILPLKDAKALQKAKEQEFNSD
ncbi:MAG: hypothetical protein JWM28_3305 [Chitinophagaceae bacterium]|nr:hypothetical protein [Chitinophagaceae bacterium]